MLGNMVLKSSMAWLNSRRLTCLAGRLLLSSCAEEPPREPPLLLLRRNRLVMAGRLRGLGALGPGCARAPPHGGLPRLPAGTMGGRRGSRSPRLRASAPGARPHPPTCGGDTGQSHPRDKATHGMAPRGSPVSARDILFRPTHPTASPWD